MPFRNVVWITVFQAVSAIHERRGTEAAAAFLVRMGVGEEQARPMVLYITAAVDDLREYGRRSWDEYVCGRPEALTTSEAVEEAVTLRDQRYFSHMADLINGLGAVFERESVASVLEHALSQTDNIEGGRGQIGLGGSLEGSTERQIREFVSSRLCRSR